MKPAGQPRVACIQKFGKGLQTEVRDLARRYQDLIIDAGGRDSVELRSALVVAERVYIPIQPSQFDIWTLGRMDDLVKTAQGFNPDLRAWVVISRASTNPSVSEVTEARSLLADFEHLSLAQRRRPRPDRLPQGGAGRVERGGTETDRPQGRRGDAGAVPGGVP